MNKKTKEKAINMEEDENKIEMWKFERGEWTRVKQKEGKWKEQTIWNIKKTCGSN